MVNLFQHLLPDGRAFRITADKYLRKLFESLYLSIQAPIRTLLDGIPFDYSRTADWREMLGLMYSTDIEAAWSELGSSRIADIQFKLRAAGFDVYVHESWYRPPLQGWKNYDPREYLWPTTVPPIPVPTDIGYPLVNKLYRSAQQITAVCGDPDTVCGGENAVCGYAPYSLLEPKLYTLPDNTDYWPYFIYIGGYEFGSMATVEPDRREEFEYMCLQLFPAQYWLGMMIEYAEGLPIT